RTGFRLDDQLHRGALSLHQVTGQATDAVATHLGGGAVGVGDVHERRPAPPRGKDGEAAVPPNPAPPIADRPGPLRANGRAVAGLPEDEVVAEPVVLRESHGAS